jgi:WD40 repeat protein
LGESRASTPQPFKTIANTTWAAAFNSDGDSLALGRQDGKISLLQGPKFSQEKQLAKDDAGPVIQSLAFGGNTEPELYSGHVDGSILKWDLHGRKPTKFGQQLGQVFQLSVSKDREWLAASSDSGLVTIWAAHHPEQPVIKLGPHGGPVWNFELGGQTGNWVVAASGTSIFLWTRRGMLAPQIELSVDPKASSLPVKSSDAQSYSIDVNGTPIRLRHREGEKSASWAARASSGDYLAVAVDDGPVLLYSTPEEYPIAALVARPRKWKAVTFERDMIVAYSESGDRVSWPFFRTKDALVAYANRHIPVVDGQPMRLNPELLCLLADTRQSEQPECKSSKEQNNPSSRQAVRPGSGSSNASLATE